MPFGGDWDEAAAYDYRDDEAAWPFDGVVMIPPIDQLVGYDWSLGGTYDPTETVLGREVPSFRSKLLPLDWFHCSIYVALLDLPPPPSSSSSDKKETQPLPSSVMVAVDIHDIVSSEALDGNVCLTLESYMEGVLARKGCVAERLLTIFPNGPSNKLVDRRFDYWKDKTLDIKEF